MGTLESQIRLREFESLKKFTLRLVSFKPQAFNLCNYNIATLDSYVTPF